MSQARLTVTGQEQWVKQLKWEGLPGFNKLRWTALDDPASPGATGAFCKTYRNFAFYWILKAGHMVRCCGGEGFPMVGVAPQKSLRKSSRVT